MTVTTAPAVTLYEYTGIVRSVYDGDTIRLDLDLGFNIWKYNESMRLYGINAFEMTGTQRERGIVARDALRERILHKQVYVRTLKDKQEKYGRYLAVIYDADGEVNAWLVEKGYAVPYMVES